MKVRTLILASRMEKLADPPGARRQDGYFRRQAKKQSSYQAARIAACLRSRRPRRKGRQSPGKEKQGGGKTQGSGRGAHRAGGRPAACTADSGSRGTKAAQAAEQQRRQEADRQRAQQRARDAQRRVQPQKHRAVHRWQPSSSVCGLNRQLSRQHVSRYKLERVPIRRAPLRSRNAAFPTSPGVRRTKKTAVLSRKVTIGPSRPPSEGGVGPLRPSQPR